MTKSTAAGKTKTAVAPTKVAKTTATPKARSLDTTARARSKPAANGPAGEPKQPAAAPKNKLVRDSFTIPKSEYLVLEALKLRAAKLARPTKKSEVIRAGIRALSGMNDKAFLAALGAIPSIKTGRPKTEPSSET